MRQIPSALGLFLVVCLGCPSPAQTSGAPPAPPALAPRETPAPAPTLPPDARALDAVFLGDFGTGGPGQQAIATMLTHRINRPTTTLLFTTGDNFYPKGVESVDDEKFKRVIADVYGPLGVPIYPSLGNHDHLGNVQAQVAYSKVNAQWRLPHRYHSFTHSVGGAPGAAPLNVRFVVVDTDPLRRGDNEQVAWLKKTLRTSDATYTIILGHHPIYSAGPHGDDATLGAVLTPLLNPSVVDAYVAGHDHILQVVGERDGVLHLVAGGGAGEDRPYPVASAPGVFAFTGGGVVHLRATPEALHFALVNGEGKTRFVHKRPRRALPAATGTSGPPSLATPRPTPR